VQPGFSKLRLVNYERNTGEWRQLRGRARGGGSLQSLATCLRRLNPPMGTSVAKKCQSLQKPSAMQRESACPWPDFGPMPARNGHRHLQVFGSQRVSPSRRTLIRRSHFHTGTAPCTNSCRKKILENQLSGRYTLAAPSGSSVDQIRVPASSVSVFRMKSARAFA